MTCEEFIRVVTTLDPRDMTRGHRAAMMRHVLVCRECREWIESQPAAEDPEATVLFNQDVQDAEFVEVIIGPNKEQK